MIIMHPAHRPNFHHHETINLEKKKKAHTAHTCMFEPDK